MTIVPEPDYAKRHNYDLSHLTLKRLPSDFDGYLMIAEWDETVKNVFAVRDGKLGRKIKLLSPEAVAKGNSASRSSGQMCYPTWVPHVVFTCVIVPTGDDIADQERCQEQGHWIDNGGYEYDCDDDGNDEDPDPDPEPDPDPYAIYGCGDGEGADASAAIGKLCAYYNFTNVGNSYTGTLKNLMWEYRYVPGGNPITILYPESCLSVANYDITQTQASAIFNQAFDIATQQVLSELNAGILPQMQVQLRLKNLIQGNLTALKPGSTWSAIAPCAGSIAVTNIKPSSYCP